MQGIPQPKRLYKTYSSMEHWEFVYCCEILGAFFSNAIVYKALEAEYKIELMAEAAEVKITALIIAVQDGIPAF